MTGELLPPGSYSLLDLTLGIPGMPGSAGAYDLRCSDFERHTVQ